MISHDSSRECTEIGCSSSEKYGLLPLKVGLAHALPALTTLCLINSQRDSTQTTASRFDSAWEEVSEGLAFLVEKLVFFWKMCGNVGVWGALI